MEYESNNVGFDEQYPGGGGIKCKNYELCEAVLPTWWWDCKNNYLCTNCHTLFGAWTASTGERHTGKGVLNVADNIDCPVCLQTKRGISYPRCDHMVCFDCFKQCHGYDFDDEKIVDKNLLLCPVCRQ